MSLYPNVVCTALDQLDLQLALIDTSPRGLGALLVLGALATIGLRQFIRPTTERGKIQQITGVVVFAVGCVQFLLFRESTVTTTVQVFMSVLLAVIFAVAVGLCFATGKLPVSNPPVEESGPESLRETQQLLSLEQYMTASLVDNLPDSIYFKDKESKFIRCNQRTADVFHLSSPADAIGKSDHDFFSKEEADEYRADELRIMRTGEPIVNKEERELWPDGKYHWVLSTKLPLKDADQNIIGTLGLSRDISELKDAQESLRSKVEELEDLHNRYTQERDLFSLLIENIPDAVFFKDRESKFIRVNPAMARDAQFDSPDELIGLTDADVWGEELAESARSDEVRIMETGEPIIGKQEEVRTKDGSVARWVLATKMPLKTATGETIGTFGVAHDITTLRLTQQWLSDSQERFELAVKGTNDGLWDWNVETDAVWYAPRFRELLHFDSVTTDDFPDQLSSFMDSLHPNDKDRVMEDIDRHLEGGPPHDQDFRLRLSSGRYRWFRGRGQAMWNSQGHPIRMAGSIQDIHEQHETQTALRRLQIQLQQALEGGNVGMWDWDIISDRVDVSPELMQQIGEDPENPWTSLQDWDNHLHPDDRDAAKQRTLDYINGATKKYESSFRLRHSDGTYRWILSRGRLFRDTDGQPRRFIGVHVDVTELRETEQALAESEAKFRGIFHQTFQFIGLLSPDGTVIDANQAALQGAGVSTEEVVGRKFYDTVWWTHSEELRERLKAAINTAAAGSFDRFEASHPAPDGSTIIVDFSLKPVTDDDGNVVWLIPEGRDVTELKRYQQQLSARSEELERSNRELEQFAYVASHDLQEPLRTIVGFSDLLKLEYGDVVEGEGQTYLNAIADGGTRMQQLITDLLQYSRVARMGRPFELTSLNDILEQVQLLLHRAIEDSGAEIEVAELPSLPVDSGQMTRLFQNVLGNAIKYRRDEKPLIRIWAEEDADSVNLFVSDNGIGIAEQFSEQIFDVFRRLHTRDEYPGTGIGLAVCRRIAERHGGSIELCYGHPRRVGTVDGSTFRITLPKLQPSDKS